MVIVPLRSRFMLLFRFLRFSPFRGRCFELGHEAIGKIAQLVEPHPFGYFPNGQFRGLQQLRRFQEPDVPDIICRRIARQLFQFPEQLRFADAQAPLQSTGIKIWGIEVLGDAVDDIV